ncbi:MAG: glycosyltransferase family 2 protein [Myxococcales bacterium]|nr:glycosyltransferase family 2 protein [Myxococcales bacterium]
MSQATSEARDLTIVIPLYNEEGILRASVTDLVDRMGALDVDYQIVLAENGSTDRTLEICEELRGRYPQVSYFSTGEPGNGNYGKALRQGIVDANGRFVICDEIDLCDTGFYRDALRILKAGEADLVIGSKLADGASDERPFVRHLGSLVINGMLRVALDFRGTDTHGLKAFRREALMPIVDRCIVDRDLFASELVIRAERAGVPIREIPVRIKEMREPSVHLFRRVPGVLKNLAQLVVAIRLRG